MKKTYVLLLSVFLISCSLSDDATNLSFVRLAVETATPPESGTVNNRLQIPLTYFRPTSCHFVEGFEIIDEDRVKNIFTFTLVASFIEQNNCQELASEEQPVLFDFFPITTDTYIFRFWQGTDANGNDQYLTVEVPVEAAN